MTTALPDWKGAVEPTPPREGTSIKSIVLPLDDSEESRTAIPIARKLSELYKAVLHVTYLGESSFDLTNEAGRFGLTAEQARGAVLDQSSGRPFAFSRQRNRRSSLATDLRGQRHARHRRHFPCCCPNRFRPPASGMTVRILSRQCEQPSMSE